jgi:hypothetical protein
LRASADFPVPVSPMMRTGASPSTARSIPARASAHTRERPTMNPGSFAARLSFSNSSLRVRLLRTAACRASLRSNSIGSSDL